MGFWPFSSEHFMDRGDPMFLSDALYRPKRMVSYPAAQAMSPDVDRLPATLDIITQAYGTKRVLAHAVRFAKMSVASLARLAYPAYLEFRDAVRLSTPSFSDSGRQMVWVPIYCAYQVQLFRSGPISWTLSSLKPGPFIIGNAARAKRQEAVAEAARSVEQYQRNAGSVNREGALLAHPDAPDVHWFHRPPLSTDPAAVAAEAMWRTVKQIYPNEVALAELAI
jgi:hypothetical protein